MFDRRKFRQLIGESARELRILVLVFVPIDAFFQPVLANRVAVAGAMAGALLLTTMGIIIEAMA